MYHSTKPYKTCPYAGCDAVFLRTKPLNVHIRNVHRENKIKCNHCGKTFQSESGIRKHLVKKHTNEFEKLPEVREHCVFYRSQVLPIEQPQPVNHFS